MAPTRHYESVRSQDGVRIAYECRGDGPPLLMVHGSSVDHTRWGSIVTTLAERFTLLMMDRRGRGRSGDGSSYAIEREFEDVAAVVEASPVPVRVLAHSYGAVCALEAACLTTRIERMVLYEPPLPVAGSFARDLAPRLADLLADGRSELLVETFLREVLHMNAAEINRVRRRSSWPLRLATATTLPREVGAAASYRFFPERFAALRVQVLFLHGDSSPTYMQESTQLMAATIAGSRLEFLIGQGHGAMTAAPKLFLEKVLPFLCAGLP